MLSELVLVAALLLVVGYLRLTGEHGYWRRQNVPHRAPAFPFGSVLDALLMRKTTGQVFAQIYREFPEEEACGYFVFGKPALLLREPELVKQVLVREFKSFHDNAFRVDLRVEPLLALNPFTTTGPKWKSMRAIHTPSHSVRKLKTMVKEMVDVAQAMVSHLRTHKNMDVESKEMSCLYTVDVVARTGFGYGGNSFEGEGAGFRAATQGSVFSSNLLPNLATLAALFAPSLSKLFRFRIFSKELEKFFVGMVKQAREERSSTALKRSDLLQQLLDAKDPSRPDNPGYTDLEIAGHCMTLFIDGGETSGLVLGYVLYELARNPEAQTELRTEVESQIGGLDSLTYDQVHSLPYLDMVLSETLRLHPPIMSVGRTTTEDVTLKSGEREWKLKKGQMVTVPVLALHHDPSHFPSPRSFRPRRFAEDSFHKFAYLPFGEGPRICLGMRFALTQIKVAVIAIMKNFVVEPRDWRPVQMTPMSTFVKSPKEGIWLRFIELQQNS